MRHRGEPHVPPPEHSTPFGNLQHAHAHVHVHVCMIVNHDNIFVTGPERACHPSAPWKKIEIAGQCFNRALACATGMTLLIVGAPSHVAAASWSVSPHPRLHQNRLLVAALEAIVGGKHELFNGFSCDAGRADRGDGIVSRHPTWNKVLLLMHGAELLPECGVLGVMDPDGLAWTTR